MQGYRKLIAAIVGVAVMASHRFLGIDFSGMEQEIIDVAVGVATVLVVERVPNEQKKPKA